MTRRHFALLMLLAAFATVWALILLDPTAHLPAGTPIEPTPTPMVTPATAGPPVPYIEEP